MVHNSCSSCVVKSMGRFFLRVVSGILPAMFFFTSSNKKMFRFTSFSRLFNFLREIFLTSLG